MNILLVSQTWFIRSSGPRSSLRHPSCPTCQAYHSPTWQPSGSDFLAGAGDTSQTGWNRQTLIVQKNRCCKQAEPVEGRVDGSASCPHLRGGMSLGGGRGRRQGRRREVREGAWRPGGASERGIEKRGGRRGVEREIGRGEMVGRRWRVRAGRGEVHGRWRVSGGGVRLSERWVFIPRVLMPEWRFGLSRRENPAVRLQGVLGNVVGIIWREGQKNDGAQ